jgi:hypothetical protein
MSGQECVNYFLRPFPDTEGGGFALVGSPGLEEFCDTGTGSAIRGQLATTNYNYVVSNKSFFKVSMAGTATEIGSGTIVSSSGAISMATNGVDVTFVDQSGGGYVYDIELDTLSAIGDADFPGGNNIVYISGYYFVNRTGTQEIHQSAWNDGTSWPGYFDSAGQVSDIIVDMIEDHGELIVIGKLSTEVWYNAGLAGFILARRQGAFLEQGSPSPFTAYKANNAFYFLGQDKNGTGQVFQSLGLQLSTVSTPAIEYQISQFSNLSKVIGFCYEQIGQTFYALIFPDDDKTFIYDTGNQVWHERSSILTIPGTTITKNGRWRANNHQVFNGDNIVGDFENGKLYKLKLGDYDEDGVRIISTRKSPIIRKNQDRITIKELQILCEPGVGITTGDDSDEDPHFMLSWSTDGGFDFGNEIPIKIGEKGEYANRAITPPLGQGRNWVLNLVDSSKTKKVIVGAFADIQVDNG